ncbi:LapA family protein [Draconibacterium orientale]|uniref:LapA family protein n=1 Tax=Draconibacterium orientale TaxID=1168034 RepID=UPI002A0A113B|nr:LapA family protein [Draconibacterium orientale]
MQLIVVILLILAVLLVIFTLQNAMDITLNIFFWEIKDAPLVLVLLSCIFLGYLISAFYFYPRLWKVKREYKQMLKFNTELQELHQMNATKKPEEETDPEGIELDDDDDTDDTFFKD